MAAFKPNQLKLYSHKRFKVVSDLPIIAFDRNFKAQVGPWMHLVLEI